MSAEEAQRELEPRLRVYSWRWGGAAASARVDGYYRSELTVVHLHAPGIAATELGRALRIVPDANGPVIMLQRPGQAAFDGQPDTKLTKPNLAQSNTVHPLLVWAELLEEGNERSAEAAAEWATTYLEASGHADR